METTSWSMFRPLNYLVLKLDTILNWKTTLIIFIVKPPNDLYTLRVCKRAGVAGSNIIHILSAPSDRYLNMLSKQDIPEHLSGKLESIQKQAFKIVFPDYSYDEALTFSGLESLEKRRLAMSRRFVLAWRLRTCQEVISVP